MNSPEVFDRASEFDSFKDVVTIIQMRCTRCARQYLYKTIFDEPKEVVYHCKCGGITVHLAYFTRKGE